MWVIKYREWDKIYNECNSAQINNIVKEYEAIPFVHLEVRIFLEKKEAELIKRRNEELFRIKVL